jgi:hypothetical protein
MSGDGLPPLPPAIDPNSLALNCSAFNYSEWADNFHELKALPPCPEGFVWYHWLWTVAGISAITATLISGWIVYKHLRHYNMPEVQKLICRIIIMLPVRVWREIYLTSPS